MAPRARAIAALPNATRGLRFEIPRHTEVAGTGGGGAGPYTIRYWPYRDRLRPVVSGFSLPRSRLARWVSADRYLAWIICPKTFSQSNGSRGGLNGGPTLERSGARSQPDYGGTLVRTDTCRPRRRRHKSRAAGRR